MPDGPEVRLRYGAFVATLVDAGIAMFSYDKRGVGESQGSCCPGDNGHFNLLSADVAGAVAALASRADVRADRIGLMGASQDRRDLLPHPLERPADRCLRGTRSGELGDQVRGLPHILINRLPVVSPQHDREVHAGHGRNWIVGKLGERLVDVLHDRVF